MKRRLAHVAEPSQRPRRQRQPSNKRLKAAVRARMDETGERYTTAREAIIREITVDDRAEGAPWLG